MSESSPQCPHCGQAIAARAAVAGQLLQCPGCRKVFPAQVGAPRQAARQPRQPSTGAPPAYPQPVGYATAGGYGSGGYGAGGYGSGAARSNRAATISLVCGIVFYALITVNIALTAARFNSELVALAIGLVGLIMPILALIFGIVGLRRSRGRRGGKGKSIAGISLGGVALLLAAASLTVALPRAREGANRVRCAANLRSLGQAMMMYANENRGHYPPRPEDLLRTQEISAECFVCPSTGHTPASGDTPDQRIANLSAGGHHSFVYLGAGKSSATPANFVLVYEPMTNHGEGFNALFGDGHVEFVSGPTAQKVQAELQAGQNPPPSYR
jgi:prepilin-type processing-associated H-X9-DG protein